MGQLSDVLKGTHGHSEVREMHRSGVGTRNRSRNPRDPHPSMDKSTCQTTDKHSPQSVSPSGQSQDVRENYFSYKN